MDSTPKASDSSANALVDPFLKEALQNPRHRLTILRMELDIQSFLKNHDQQLFEFPHFPTSYLRLAAHRVAQHYGLQSMVADSIVDGLRTRIVVRKTAETRQPAICLSEVPAEQPENDKPEQVKIAIRKRSQNASLDGGNETGGKQSSLKTMEERKEEYDRARARIFNSSSSPNPEDVSVNQEGSLEEKNCCPGMDANKGYTNLINERESSPVSSDGSASRVAIFRDLEKDRSDPDYDRSYERYVRSPPPNQNYCAGVYNLQSFQPTFVKYEVGFPQHGVIPTAQASLNYRPPAPIMSPFCAVGDSPYGQYQNLAMMYTHPYEQVRHAVYQVPFYHQPLSFNYSQNY